MNGRVDVNRHFNSGMPKTLLALSNETAAKVERSLFELVKIRASQINGCAYCLDMHTKDARAAGETEQRIYTLMAVAFRAPVGTYQPRAVAASPTA